MQASRDNRQYRPAGDGPRPDAGVQRAGGPSVWLAERPLVLAVLVGFGIWVLLKLVGLALWVIVVVLVSLILSSAMLPIVRWMCKPQFPPGGWRIPRVIAVLIIYTIALVVIVAVGYFVGTRLVQEISAFLKTLPGSLQGISDSFNQFSRQTGVPAGLLPSPSDFGGQLQSAGGRLLLTIESAGAAILQLGLDVFLVLILSLFLVTGSDRLFDLWLDLMPPRNRPMVAKVTRLMVGKMGYWLLGQLVVATTNGVLAGLGMWVLGIPYPIMFGVMTALLDLTPMLGPALMSIPAGLVGLTVSPLVGALAAAYLILLAELEGHLLHPLITGRLVRLDPIAVVICIPLGLALYGPVGALMAVPITAALHVVSDTVLLPWLRRREGVPEEVVQEKEAETLEKGG
jgi:predicted PurR-regulated permease PerM